MSVYVQMCVSDTHADICFMYVSACRDGTPMTLDSAARPSQQQGFLPVGSPMVSVPGAQSLSEVSSQTYPDHVPWMLD